VRPPGHHALSDQAMGFCVFANVAVAVRHARTVRGVERVAVVDWDVHHGNGTQDAFYADPSVLTISLHQDGGFPPGSGGVEEVGAGDAVGANLNVPLPAGSGTQAYLVALEQVVLPALEAFRPALIVVACGFDASAFDPLGRQLLHSDSFRALTAAVVEAADRMCEGRLVLAHEGGYSSFYVPFCGLAALETLTGRRTAVVDPFLALVADTPGQALQPDQQAAIDRAARHPAVRATAA